MASGKKGKKTKGKTLALNDFLQETTGSIPIQPIRKSNLNWADEVEDYDDVRKPINVVLPTAPKASRDYEDISDKVPTEPPFCAYLSNLPYEIEEDEIADFFKNMKIASMRIPKGDRGGESKSRGYGYIEFEDRDSLLSALVMSDSILKSRRIRIDVASANDDRRRGGGGGRMDMNRDRSERSESFGDWRSGPRQTENEDRRSGFNRDRDRDGGGGSFTREGMRDRDDKSFSRDNMRDRDRDFGRDKDREFTRRDGNRDFGRDRDRDGNRDFGRDRDGRDSYRRDNDEKPGGWRDGERANRDNDGERERGYNRDRGNYRDSERSGRFDDKDRDKDDRRGGYGGRRFEDRERRDGFSRSDRERDSEPPPSEPRERPKLVLAPRTKPVEVVPVSTESVPSASIFGNAKPVDTSQREREIEAKLAKESEKPRDSSKDREKKFDDKEDDIEKTEKPRLTKKIEDSLQKEKDSKDVPPKRNFDDKKLHPKSDQKSPDKSDNRHKNEKSEKPKREEKRERHEKDMPKLTEPQPPNFAANNKFAFLQTDDNSD